MPLDNPYLIAPKPLDQPCPADPKDKPSRAMLQDTLAGQSGPRPSRLKNSTFFWDKNSRQKHIASAFFPEEVHGFHYRPRVNLCCHQHRFRCCRCPGRSLAYPTKGAETSQAKGLALSKTNARETTGETPFSSLFTFLKKPEEDTWAVQ